MGCGGFKTQPPFFFMHLSLKDGDYSPSRELRFCEILECRKSNAVSISLLNWQLSLPVSWTQPPCYEELYPAEMNCSCQTLPKLQMDEGGEGRGGEREGGGGGEMVFVSSHCFGVIYYISIETRT